MDVYTPTLTEAHDWRHEMRWEIQEIIPGLWLGPYACARKKDMLKAKGITHMLCIRDQNERHLVKVLWPDDFVYGVIEVSESPLQNLIPHFPACRSFIASALHKPGTGAVFVHCNTGMSRSPAIVVAYLMMEKKMAFQEAYAVVQNRRFCMNPQEGFKLQLKEFEPIWKAQLDPHLLSTQSGSINPNGSASMFPETEYTAQQQRRKRSDRDDDEFADQSGGGHPHASSARRRDDGMEIGA
ncbi:protein-tyrosine phosphatase-like protein [Fimicolochytrium jonesii]|uniref:protein-tyrosine phosphatase-like protein n=1 Tax=Fimicolochytrium jonesii TaxID=1396493 RepID=UPI0022FE7F6F|nr:protein-tyrosine phosphatase-like protein [Fimicolochytrium jonesii]KAI8820412.1 protein-tyrosine phosphatase-like protein [Fimicolochytrium jonesii]